MKKKYDLHLFATIDDVVSTNQDAFKDSPDFAKNFGATAEHLKGLGYDVLINKRDSAEYVPSTRLSEVVKQRDDFKTQYTNLQQQLESIKKQGNVSPETEEKLNKLISENNTLLKQVEESTINLEIISQANDAINPKDIVAFIDRSKIAMDKTGNIVGVKAEIDRIKAEKPYMFNTKQQGNPSSGGMDSSSGSGSESGAKNSMNGLIRRAAGLNF